MTRSTLFSRNHPTFLLVKKIRSADVTGSFLSKKLFKKTPMLKSLLNKFFHKACNFIKKWFQHRCFPVNIGKVLKPPVLKNNCVRPLLKRL